MKKRIAIIQPYIPKYRIPLFQRLGDCESWDLHVVADIESDDQLNQYSQFVPVSPTFSATHAPLRIRGPFVHRPGLRRTLREIRPDVTVFNCSPRDVGQYLLMREHHREGRCLGLWGMFYRIGSPRWWSEFLMREMGRMASRVFCYGKRDTNEMIARGVDRRKLITLHNAIDHQEALAARDRLSEDEIIAFRHRKALQGKRVLIQVVRMNPVKRTQVVLRMFRELLKSRSDVELVFVGGGRDEGAMKNLALKLGIGRHVRFLGPIYDEKELSLWFSSADVFVMATCTGFSLHHAMVYVLPAVTDDSPRTQSCESEALVDGSTGLRYRAGDIKDFTAKVRRILDDDELAARLSKNAVDRITRDYTLDAMAERFRGGIYRLLEAA